MRTGQVVIGANFGDEGKGLMTDYLASKNADRSVVVRFNGGAQAGHTVVTPDGRRHVFSHFGSGTFAGCPSHLSEFFIVNPMTFVKEHRELIKKGARPVATIDGDAYLTTPFDMLINRLIERKRGNARHGSCGLGVNETVTRCFASPSFRTQAKEMLDATTLIEKFHHISENWLPRRMQHLGLDLDGLELDLLNKSEFYSAYLYDMTKLLKDAKVTTSTPQFHNFIFEGAQGLMLDEERMDQFPHVTRSRTGIANVLYLADKYQLDELQIIYVTRSYMTRHGAGPFRGECDWKFEDETNVSNEFQGTLRFAPLDLCELRHSISIDLARLDEPDCSTRGMPKVRVSLALTCLDQHQISLDSDFGVPLEYVSYGKTREHIVERSLPKEMLTGFVAPRTVSSTAA